LRKAVFLAVCAASLLALALFAGRLLLQEVPPAPEAGDAPFGATKPA
jgi:hypothetical protein